MAGKYPIPDRACPRITPPPPVARKRSQRAGERRYPSPPNAGALSSGRAPCGPVGLGSPPARCVPRLLGGRAGCRVYRQITPDSGARVARSMQASDANLPTADHFELDNIGPVQVCVPSGNGHTGMGEPWLSSILSGPGARRPGGSARAGHRGPKHSPPCRRSPTLAVHAPQTIPPSRRTRDGSTLVSNLHQLDGRDLFVALNLVAGEFRSDPYLKPQGGIASFP
jgi:hypothetical protein